MNLILFNRVLEDLLFTSYRSVRLQAIRHGFMLILWVDIFGFVQPSYLRASAAIISMVVGVLIEISKNHQMLYFKLHLDYCRY